MTVATEPSAPSRPLRAAGFTGFVLLGAALALYGPAVPLFREQYGVSTSVAGMALPVQSVTAIVGVLIWGALDRSGRIRGGLMAGALAGALGALAIAFAPTFAVVLLGVAGIGIGFGILDTGLNALFARDRTDGAGSRMNALHGVFGIGAVGSPLLLSVGGLTTTYVVVGLAMFAIIPAVRSAIDPGVLEADDTSAAARRTAKLVFAGFLALFALYIGVELGVANWMAAHLSDQGWSNAAAARWTSAYFLAFTIGRFVIARFGAHIHPARVVITSLALGGVLVLFAAVATLTPWAYVAVGLVIAPVFPTGMIWIARRLPENRHGPAGAMLAGSVGATILPGAVGLAVAASGTSIVPFAVAITAAAAVGVAVWVRRTAAVAPTGP